MRQLISLGRRQVLLLVEATLKLVDLNLSSFHICHFVVIDSFKLIGVYSGMNDGDTSPQYFAFEKIPQYLFIFTFIRQNGREKYNNTKTLI